MARQIGWRWYPGKVCPYCCGAVQYVTETVPDRHSPMGFSEVRKPVYVMVDKQVSASDKVVEIPMETRGHTEYVKTRWSHALDVCCNVCNVMLSSDDLVPGEPKEYPPGYWVEVE